MVRVHGNALKHGLTSEEVAYAWENPIRCRQRNGTDDPPLWISVGSLPDGRFAELIGFMDIDGVWCVFHAMVPPTKKFKRAGMEVDMNGIVAENGKVVTDEMIADWESALERDEWPSGWVNVGEIVEGKLPKAAPETVTLSLKVPAAMKRALEKEAKAEGKSTGAYARGILADGLMAIA